MPCNVLSVNCSMLSCLPICLLCDRYIPKHAEGMPKAKDLPLDGVLRDGSINPREKDLKLDEVLFLFLGSVAASFLV